MNFHHRFIGLILSFVTIFSHVSLIRFANKKKYFKNYTKLNSKNLRSNLCRIGCVVLISSLLLTSTPAAIPITVGAASEFKQDAVFWAYQNNWLGHLYNYFFTPAVESNSNQNAQIDRIKIFPGGTLSLGVGSKTVFAAIAYDSDNNPIPGVKFHWKMKDRGRGRNPRSLQNGVFEAELPGIFEISVKARGKEAESIVTVTGTPLGILESQLANAPQRRISSRQDENLNGSQFVDSNDKAEGEEKAESAEAENKTTDKRGGSIDQEISSMNMLPEANWNDNNWQTADDSGNTIGNPPGKTADEGAGSGNFQIAAPVLSLPGRSVNLALNLNYNSRLWNKSGSEITYDIDRGFPAPGWSLGFGKVAFMGANGGCMIVDADGTRHGYTGQISSWSSGASFNGYTTDGSFINYGCNVYYGQSSNAWAKLANGTEITYSQQGAANDHIYPTSITDAQGNYISITYRNGQGPNIETITDTLGRVIQFQYDSLGRLISITAPKMGGGARVLVRLHYQQRTLNYSFTGLTPVVRNNSPYLLDAIYYPSTGTGYWFGDSDSYSSYGMIAKVVEQRGMSWSAGSEEQGTVTPGQMTKQGVYSYPLNPAGGLSDAPTYGQLTETWAEMDDAASVTTYETSNSTSVRIVTVTQPNGTKTKQYSYKTGDWKDGLVYEDETVSPSGALLSKSTVTWEQGDYGSPRPVETQVTTYLENGGLTSKTAFTYGAKFNQIISARQYGYDGVTLLRETRTEFENSANYIGQTSNGYYSGRHIFNLVKATEIFDASGTRMSRTQFEYDNAPLNAIPPQPEMVHHKDENDPYSTATRWVRGACIQTAYSQQAETDGASRAMMSDPCIEYQYNEVPVFDPSTNYRGNVTSETSFSNASNLTGGITDTKRYDIAGNLVTKLDAGGTQTGFNYTIDTQYAYPNSQTVGAADVNSPHRITTSAVYNFETGLVTQTTNANGRSSSIQYNAETLRPTSSYLSTGAYTNYAYDDAAMTVTEEVRENGGALAGKSVKRLNGLGKVKREEALAPNNAWDVAEVKYDKLGREWKQTKPYRNGVEMPQWSEIFYDALGRTTKVVEPDGIASQAFYNEANRPDSASALPGQTVRSVDAWGRERWIRNDEQGRLVEVVEPNPNGNGSVFTAGSLVTRYKYDTFGRLIETEQADQRRYFAYDSLGRLTRQKLAEQSATLNGDGVYVGAGGQWGEAFWYDNRSNVIQQTDARGVKTQYSHQIGGANDPLNRLQSVYYDLSGPRDPNVTIHGAWSVVYEYETAGDKTRPRRVTASGMSTEEYFYNDSEGRLSDHTLTITARPNHPMTTSYIYDTLDRVTDVRYPAQYGLPSNPRKVVHYDHDAASRLSSLKYNDQTQASEFIYNAASLATSLKIGTGANQLTEEYEFDQQNGLLTNQKVKRANGERILDLSYEYRRKVNGNYVAGRTGHLTEIINNLDANKNRAYEYDALGRLVKATGGINQSWMQRYAYDRYGNRTSVTANGMEALRMGQASTRVNGDSATGTLQQPIVGNGEQNAALPKSVATVAPPSAEQLVQNVNNFVKVGGRGGKGASSDSPSSGNETTEKVVTKSANDNADDSRVVDEKTDNQKEDKNLSLEGVTTPDKTQSEDSTFDQAAKEQSAKLKQSKTPGAVNNTALSTLTRTAFDFDGDGKADLSTWGRTNGNWKINRSGSGQTTTTQLGASGNQIAPGDYDGDGKTDEAVWNPSNGVWTIKQSSTGSTYTQQWGLTGDAIVPADYDGDGRTDIAVWRPSTGYWYALRSSDGSLYALQWGGQQFGDIPTVGDYDGDGRSDAAVWRPSNGDWYIYILQSSSGQIIQAHWGQTGDVPVPMDYDADRKTDLAVWRPSAGAWYISQSSNGQFVAVALGSESTRDVLVPADYDGDGRADAAVWTPSTGTWTIRQSTTGTNVSRQLGASGELAVPSAYIRRSSAPKNQNAEIQRDGHANLSYDPVTNRITTSNASGQFEYDAAGNQIRALAQDGQTWQRFEYDAANRLVYVKNDAGAILQSFTYGATNQRLISRNGAAGDMTFYAWDEDTVIAEYTEYASQPNNPVWTKSYIFLGERLLSTATPNAQGSESFEYHHPDRLGTRLVSNPAMGSFYEQATMPFGTALASESTGATARRFTSYDRSNITGLDYAMNRTYDSMQGRFTQVDPIGMDAVSLADPQSLNLFAYCGNDPINHVDPDGLFFGKLFKWIAKAIDWIGKAVTVAILVIGAALLAYATGGAATAWLGNFVGWSMTKAAPFLAKYFWWATPGYLAPLKIGTPPINGGGGGFGSFISRAFPDGDGAVLDIGVVGVVTITAPWYTRGVVGAIGDLSRGIANGFTLGLVDYVDRHWHKVPEEEFERLRNSTAHNVGEWTGFAASLAIPGGAGVKALKLTPKLSAAASRLLGPSSKLFGRHKIGLLNRNDYVRIGWSWKGSAKNGRNVFRIAIGSKRGRIHKHFTIWPR